MRLDINQLQYTHWQKITAAQIFIYYSGKVTENKKAAVNVLKSIAAVRNVYSVTVSGI
jgi:hypothetical protein